VVVKLGIIGTAGRREDGPRMSRLIYKAMAEKAYRLIQAEWQLKPSLVQLVSGGAAWSDHLTVDMFLAGAKRTKWANRPAFHSLKLHLPAPWDAANRCYSEVQQGTYNEGSISNWYHNKFTQRMIEHGLKDYNSLARLHRCIQQGQQNRLAVTTRVASDFFTRNRFIANDVDYLMAFTWGQGPNPKKGGTLHTWEHAQLSESRKIHVSLNDLTR
jgi:hypothetical protein